jgi:thioester reductase-like protein
MEKLAAVVGGVVGRSVDPDEPLHTGGMAVDSLVAAEVLSAAGAALGREIPLGLWFEARSLADLAQRLDRGTLGARAPAFDLPARDRDLDLPAPAAGAGRVPFETVVLTGATGLLGAHLLESLVARTRARVVCLVRAASDEAAVARVYATLDRYRIPCPARERWTALAADLAVPGLGMAPAERLALAGEADAILHAGAEVSWIHPYEKLRAPNVLGTLEVLSLATAQRRVPVHFVSTISTAPGVGDETTTLSFERARAGGGYGLTKWIAEHLVKRAAGEGHPAAVYRPAMIAGHSKRGHGNPDDYVNRYLRACVTSGRYLDLPGERLDMTPVDFVADGIVALMTAHPEGGSTYHLTNVEQSMTYRALGEAIAGAGYACAPASYAAFVEAAVKPKGSPLAPLASYFPAAGFALGMGPWPSGTTREALAALGVVCPKVDARLVATYLAVLAPSAEGRDRS